MKMLLLTLGLEPLRLVTGESAGAGAAVPAAVEQTAMHPWWWWLGVVSCASLLAVGAAMLTSEYLRFRGESDADAAFQLLARHLHLRQGEISVVLRLSAAAGVQPVALLLSEHAFGSSLQAAGHGADDGIAPASGVDLRVIESLHRRLFAPDEPTVSIGSFSPGSMFARLRRHHDEARAIPL